MSYPYSPQEPQLSEDKLRHLDSIADQVEGERLFGLEVLLTDQLPDDSKTLSTRFVRTWREKEMKMVTQFGYVAAGWQHVNLLGFSLTVRHFSYQHLRT